MSAESESHVIVLFGSCSPDRLPRAIERAKAMGGDAPVVVVSEFAPPNGEEWIPYHLKRGLRDNLALVRARLAGRRIGSAAIVLDSARPYRRLRLLGLLVAPQCCIFLDENLECRPLRPDAALSMLRYALRCAARFARRQLEPGGFVYRWARRLRHPEALRRPVLYRAALAAGLAARLIKRGAPRAPGPKLESTAAGGISVVIPSRNGKELLACLLPSVLAQIGDRGEVIVVDNGSSDGTVEWLAHEYPHVAVEHSAGALSFAKAVNAGVRRARYSHVCLLNNDMLIGPGFFTALRSAFDVVPDLFCATAQIFLPQGERREETGKAVMPLHRAWDQFPIRCDLPLDGEDLSYVLYGSGGCSLYDAAKLKALGGIGEVFEPAYVEDLDIGFRAWRQNWPTVFVAAARVLHRRRTTTSRYYSERELSIALERNYLRFLTRAILDPRLYWALWKEAIYRINAHALRAPELIQVLASAARAPAWIEEQPRANLAEREILAIGSGSLAVFPGMKPRGKPVVLVASPYPPFPLSHGGAVRMYNLMRRAARDFDQVLVCFTDELVSMPRELLEICVEVIAVHRVGSHLHASTERPEVVEEFDSPVYRAALLQTARKWRPVVAQLEFTQMAQYAPGCAPAKTILVEHDITLDLYAQLLEQREDWETRRQYDRWVRFENKAWGSVDRVVTMSEKDRAAVGRPNAIVIPNGVDVERFRPSFNAPDPRRILFIGSFAHLPNVMALAFFLREVWPLLEPLSPVLHVIAGARREYFLERYRDRAPVDLNRRGIELDGFVADVRPAYERATVVVAPLLASAGTNIKIMEAMAMGKAVVSTPAGVNGLSELENGRDVVIVNTGEEMAYAIAGLFDDPAARRRLEEQARATAVRRYDWDVIAHRQKLLYEELISTRAGA